MVDSQTHICLEWLMIYLQPLAIRRYIDSQRVILEPWARPASITWAFRSTLNAIEQIVRISYHAVLSSKVLSLEWEYMQLQIWQTNFLEPQLSQKVAAQEPVTGSYDCEHFPGKKRGSPISSVAFRFMAKTFPVTAIDNEPCMSPMQLSKSGHRSKSRLQLVRSLPWA